MPRVNHVKSARKDYPDIGVKKGEPYYWWKFRFGGKHMSKTQPKRAQLTQSPFLQELYALEDDFKFTTPENLESEVEDYVGQLESLRDQCQESLDNIPEQLQSGSSGEILQERIDQLEGWINDVEAVDLSIDEDLDDDARQGRYCDIIEEIEGCNPGIG